MTGCKVHYTLTPYELFLMAGWLISLCIILYGIYKLLSSANKEDEVCYELVISDI